MVNGELVHELSLRRVVNEEVKDLEELTYLIECEFNRFTKDFCLIIEIRCDKSYDVEVKP
ncbi:hypothetical protein DVH24_021173 [Malus domestica]|uniref:Uncharacterized protein n=1 Tax=Malus domestica TaxID=3750 RepID=A0A498J9I9_MALDO|nr:hypothetical protein DVH24_021173 [Malus domestica]